MSFEFFLIRWKRPWLRSEWVLNNRKSFFDLGLLWTGAIGAAIAGMLAQMIIARALGTNAYGTLSSALGLISLAAPLTAFGVPQYWLKAFGEEGWIAIRWIRPAIKFWAISTVIIGGALALWAVIGPNDNFSEFLILALLPTLFSAALIEIIGSKFQLEQSYAKFVMLNVITPIFRLAIACVVLFFASDVNKLRFTGLGYFLASLIILAILAPQLIKLLWKDIDLKGHGSKATCTVPPDKSISHLLSESWVFGVAGLLYLAWAQGHIVAAKYALGSHDAGLYNASLVIVNAVCLLPTVAFSKFLLPKIHRWASQNFEKLKVFSRWSSITMFGVGLMTAIFLYLGSGPAIRLAFGEGYGASETILKVLAFTIPMRFLGYNAGAMLRTKQYMKLKVKALILAVVFNIVLAFFFIPRWGIIGLAATVSITEFFLVATYVYLAEFCYFREERV